MSYFDDNEDEGMPEHWKDVPGFEGRYQVSDEGRVRSVDHRVRLVAHGRETTRLVKGRVLRPGAQKKTGHLTVAIGKGNSRQVHELVMTAFEGPRPEGTEIAHNDGDPTHNAWQNLRYATRTSNSQDKVHHGKTRLSPADVDRVRREAPGAPRGGKTALAKELGVSPSLISNLLCGKAYSHV